MSEKEKAKGGEPKKVRLERWVGTVDVEDSRPLTDQQEELLEIALSKLKPGKARTTDRPGAGVKHYGPDHLVFLKWISFSFLAINRWLLRQGNTVRTRKAIKDIHSKADALHKSIENLIGFPLAHHLLNSSIHREELECHGKTPEELSNILIEFMQNINVLLPNIKGRPGRGRDGAQIRAYIQSLGSLYRDITGREPSRRETKKTTSFNNFVKECLAAFGRNIQESTISTHIAKARKQGGFPGFKAASTPVNGPLVNDEVESNVETP